MRPEQCRMGRAALNWPSSQLAEEAGVGVNTVNRFEGGADVRMSSVDKMREALLAAGIQFIEENGGGAGVRLRDNRRSRMMRAFKKIEPSFPFRQKSFREPLGVGPGDVGRALEAGADLKGEFSPDEYKVVQAAFERFGKQAPSMVIAECCETMVRRVVIQHRK